MRGAGYYNVHVVFKKIYEPDPKFDSVDEL